MIKILNLFIGILLSIYNLSASMQENVRIDIENNRKIPFFRVHSPDPLLPPFFILGSCHEASANILPDVVHQTFWSCNSFYAESLGNDEVPIDMVKDYLYGNFTFNPHIHAARSAKSGSDQMNPLEISELITYYSQDWSLKIGRKDLLEKFSQEHKVNLNTLDPCITTLLLRFYASSLYCQDGMDTYFSNEAVKQSKLCKELESKNDRFNGAIKKMIEFAFENTTFENNIKFINDNIQSLCEPNENDYQKIRESVSWNNKDYLDIHYTLESYLLPYNFENDEVSIVERNRAWMDKLSIINTSAFVIVGHSHLLGQEGILNMLIEKGYHIAQAYETGF